MLFGFSLHFRDFKPLLASRIVSWVYFQEAVQHFKALSRSFSME